MLGYGVCERLDSDAATTVTTSDAPAELVDHMESELALIEALQRDGTDRLQELLTAAQQAVDALDLAPTVRFADYRQPQPATSATADTYGPMILEKLASQDSRLDDMLHVLEQVVRQQQLITAAIQCLADRVTGVTTEAGNPLRASA